MGRTAQMVQAMGLTSQCASSNVTSSRGFTQLVEALAALSGGLSTRVSSTALVRQACLGTPESVSSEDTHAFGLVAVSRKSCHFVGLAAR